MSSASFDDPSTLPLVISFNQFVHGRGYQGRTELAVRPIGGTGGANLNEAVSLQAIAESGQASQRFTWVRFSMNGTTARTRLVVENPDQNYAVALGRGTGALFKSKATNSFTYKGEDPTAYAEDFEQLSAKGSLDLAPLIDLLDFLDHTSDEDFDASLSRWVDVDRLALYVATHDLLNNFDDMSGPGRNFMLWYDAGDRRFTVITWDMNLAITGMGGGKGMGGPPANVPLDANGLLLRAEKELLANVSHELRTPLARIRVALDLAAEGDVDTAREALAEIGDDLDELERLLSDVLTAARLDLGEGPRSGALPPLRIAPVDSGGLLVSAAQRFAAANPGRDLRVVLAEGLPTLQADSVLLRRLFENLLSNAHKYTENSKATIELAAHEEGGKLVVDVVDTGVGIAEADLPFVFRPFFRADRSRTRATGGIGLGLALAKNIAEAHGGSIAIKSKLGEGTRVTVTIPPSVAD